jgi:hypothetical protein
VVAEVHPERGREAPLRPLPHGTSFWPEGLGNEEAEIDRLAATGAVAIQQEDAREMGLDSRPSSPTGRWSPSYIQMIDVIKKELSKQ